MIDRLLKLAVSLVVSLWDALVSRLPGSRQSAGTCVVINYHTIASDAKSRFGRQLDRLLRLAKPVPAGRVLPLENGRRHVVITVDDVFQSFVANGLPELCRRNLPVMLFPPTGYLGRNSAWNDYGGGNKVGEVVASAEDLRRIARMSNVDFGSHGVMHADLVRLPAAKARQELQNSKKELEAIVGREITAFSVPYGSYGTRELQLAKETGYKFVYDSTPQQLFLNMGEGLTGRVDVQPADWNLEFRLKVCGAYRWVRRASAWERKVRSWFWNSTKSKN